MGADPTSPCAQLEHLADLLRNRVNIQWNPSIGRPKIAEDIEKTDSEEIALGWKGPWDLHRDLGLCGLGQCLPWDTGRTVRSPAPIPTRAGRAAWHQEGPGCWKSLGGIETRVGNTQKQHTSAGTVDAG